jgi:hypothetical protein
MMPALLPAVQLQKFPPARVQQEAFNNLPHVGIVGDSTHLTRSARRTHGESAKADLSAILERARRMGSVRQTWMVGDPEIPRQVVERWMKDGWKVDVCTAGRDDRVVRLCVAVAMEVDILVILSGDHIFLDALRLIQMAQKRVAVMAIRDATAPCLIRTAVSVGSSPSHLNGRRDRSYQIAAPAPRRLLG